MAYSIRFPRRHDKTDKNGHYAVRLCVTKNKMRKYISLNIFTDANYWDEDNEIFIIEKNLKGAKQKELNEQRKKNNALLEQYKVRAREIIGKFELEHIDWTLNQFEDAFFNTSRQGKFKPYLEKHVQTLRDTGHTGNAKCYFETLRLLRYYDKKIDQRLFSDIDVRYVRGFDIYLQKRGCKGNTRKYYFKALRAILNRANTEGIGSPSTYPFDKGGFQIANLEEATAKRYLPQDYLHKIKETPSTIPHCEYARQLFLLSYYCYGISFIDMAMLTSENLIRRENGTYIIYKRQKIKHQKKVTPIQIKVTPAIQHLIEQLKTESPTVDNYLLPIITRSGYTGEKLYNHIRSRYSKYRKYLSELATELDIGDFHLTSYVSRHTMAMTLQSNQVPREIISQMLGHADLEMTNTYLDSFENSVIDEAAKIL